MDPLRVVQHKRDARDARQLLNPPWRFPSQDLVAIPISWLWSALSSCSFLSCHPCHLCWIVRPSFPAISLFNAIGTRYVYSYGPFLFNRHLTGYSRAIDWNCQGCNAHPSFCILALCGLFLSILSVRRGGVNRLILVVFCMVELTINIATNIATSQLKFIINIATSLVEIHHKCQSGKPKKTPQIGHILYWKSPNRNHHDLWWNLWCFRIGEIHHTITTSPFISEGPVSTT